MHPDEEQGGARAASDSSGDGEARAALAGGDSLAAAAEDDERLMPINANPTRVPEGPRRPHPALLDDDDIIEPQRWWVLGAYAFLAALNGAQWMTYSASSIDSKVWLHTDDDTLQLFLNEGAIVYLFAVWGAMWLCTRRHGLRKSILLAAALCLLGSALRCVPTLFSDDFRAEHVNVTLAWTHAGQVANAVAAPFVQASPSLLSLMWFPVSQRRTATSIAAMANGAGRVLAFQLGAGIVQRPSDIPHVLRLELGMCALICIAVFFHLPDHPKHPPSVAARSAVAARGTHSPSVPHLVGEVLQTLRNPSVVLLAVAFSINLGVYMAVAGILVTVLETTIVPEPSKAAIANMGTAASVATVLGCMFAGFLCDQPGLKYRMKSVMVALCAGASLCFFLTGAQMDPVQLFDNATPTTIAMALAAAAFMRGGVDPLCFEMAAELTHPHPASNAGSLLTFLRSGVMIIFLSMGSKILDSWSIVIMTWAAAAAALLMTQVQGRYNRRHAESMLFSSVRFSITRMPSFAAWFNSPKSEVRSSSTSST